jgi:protocatechuate 3,4-dioxygenase beta subunit
VTVSEQGLIAGGSGRLTLPEYMKPRDGNHPPLGYPGYNSTALRHPKQPLVLLPQRLTEVTGPLLGDDLISMQDADLTTQHAGVGRAITDQGGRYRFITIQPGSYPWGNHYNAWRPAHIHMSLFGRAFTQRLVTQMYFPGDPLLPLDPIYNSVPDEKARALMVAEFSIEDTQPEWALAYRFDIVLRGREQSVFEEAHA